MVLEVYERQAADAAPIGTLTEDTGRQFTDQAGDTGSGQAQVPVGSADYALLREMRRVVKVRRSSDNEVLFSWRLGGGDPVRADTGGPSTEVATFTGLGSLVVLADALVYPQGGLARTTLPVDQRRYDWTADGFVPDAAWHAAVDVTASVARPNEVHDPLVQAIWGTGVTGGAGSEPMALGYCFFRGSVTLAEERNLAVFITADDGYELWVDGVLLGARDHEFNWQHYDRYDVFLGVGTHLFAIRGRNMPRSSVDTNVAWVRMSAIEAESESADGRLGNVVLRTDDTWLAVDYPVREPGMTAGQIVGSTLAEGQARGCFPDLSWDFTTAFDSNGDPWSSTLAVGFSVLHDNALSVLRKVVETHADVRFDHDTFTLRLFDKGAAGADRTTGPGAVTIQRSSNASRLAYRFSEPLLNVGLARRGDGSYEEVYDLSLAAAYGRIEAPLQLGASRVGGPDEYPWQVFLAVRDDHGRQKRTGSFVYEPQGGPEPYTGLFTYDRIMMEGDDGTVVEQAVRSLFVSEDQQGNLVYGGECDPVPV